MRTIHKIEIEVEDDFCPGDFAAAERHAFLMGKMAAHELNLLLVADSVYRAHARWISSNVPEQVLQTEVA